MPKPAQLAVFCCALAGCSASAPALTDVARDADSPDGAQAAEAGPEAQADADVPSWRGVTHDSFDSARRVEPNGKTHLQDELSATQVDHYVFAARAGAYYEVITDAHRFSPDNRVELFDGARALLADNDQGSIWSGDAIDARIVFRATRSEDHYLRVEDVWTPPEVFEGEPPLIYYRLRVRELISGEGVAIAGDGVAAELTLDPDTGYRHALLLGDARFDEDVFAIHGMRARALVGRVLRDETRAAGEPFDLWREVRVDDGAHRAVAIIERARDQYDFHPPLEEGDYEVRVAASAAASAHDARAFYALDVVLIPDNPPELADEANATPQGSEPMVLEHGRALLLATLPSPDDVDYFHLQASIGGQARVLCEAESGGSLVRGLHAQLEDAEGRVLATATEPAGLNLVLDIESVDTPDLFLRLSSQTAPQPAASAAWVRCAAYIH